MIQFFPNLLQNQLDPDAKLFLDAAEISSSTITKAINFLVKDLKEKNLWNKMLCIYPMVGGTAFTHKWNLKDPRDLNNAYRLSYTGTITHDNLGTRAINNSSWINTHFVVWDNGIENNLSMSFYTPSDFMLPNTPGLFTMASVQSGDATHGIIINRTNLNLTSVMGSDSQFVNFSFGNVPQLGLITGSRTAINSNRVYLNGIFRAANNTNNGGLFYQLPVLIHRGVVTAVNQICSFAHISSGLTDLEVSDLYSSVQEFQTILGRQV